MKTVVSLLILVSLVAAIPAQNATTPGVVTTPYPTVINLAVEWLIEGDANLNCTVSVQYRPKGASEWRKAMPLRRVPAGENLGFSWQNKCSGSIFDLQPGTEYEISLTLADPDGGSAEKTVTVATRPVPRIPSGAKITDLPAGTYDVLTPENGTESSPRVYCSADGSAVYDFIDLQNRQWVYLWGLTINSSGGNSARAIKANGAKNCVIRYCTMTGLYGITAYEDGLTNCYIGDNTVTGTTGWSDETMGADGDNEGEGIQFTGPGNVVCHNRVKSFRDCISTMEDEEASNQICIDIYNNDLFTGADDGIEADFCFNNCRVMRNRITNCYVGVSSQPGLGGPTYVIRNVMYNIVHGAFKFKRNSRGDVALHNTVIKVGAGLAGNDVMDFAFFRNNLAFGGPTGGVKWGGYGAGNPYAADIMDPGTHSSFDYDAVGVEGVAYIAKIGGKPFSEVEHHGVGDIKLNEVFNNVAFPNPPVPERDTVDLRPKDGSAVVDKGETLPNINDGFSGNAPDCGAYEVGGELPIYGPRPQGVDEGSAVVKDTFVPMRGFNQWNEGLSVAAIGRKLSIEFTVYTPGRVKLSLFDASGRMVGSLVDGYRTAGAYRQARIIDDLPRGCYLVCLQTRTHRQVEKFVAGIVDPVNQSPYARLSGLRSKNFCGFLSP